MSTSPPQWLSNAVQAFQARYPNDRFEPLLRKVRSSPSTPVWRIRCSDCPGKLYAPGPGKTLSAYEVHLKNRIHRKRVNDRAHPSNLAQSLVAHNNDEPPQWLSDGVKALQSKYPNDRFEALPRKAAWRIKCSDCPGKFYTPGPGETLSNFEVHLKNRIHRNRINERVNAST